MTATLTLRLFIGVVIWRDQDWVESEVFGNVIEVFKLDTGAQCIGLPKTVYDKITSMPLIPFSGRVRSYQKTCIKPVGRCELTHKNYQKQKYPGRIYRSIPRAGMPTS